MSNAQTVMRMLGDLDALAKSNPVAAFAALTFGLLIFSRWLAKRMF